MPVAGLRCGTQAGPRQSQHGWGGVFNPVLVAVTVTGVTVTVTSDTPPAASDNLIHNPGDMMLRPPRVPAVPKFMVSNPTYQP